MARRVSLFSASIDNGGAAAAFKRHCKSLQSDDQGFDFAFYCNPSKAPSMSHELCSPSLSYLNRNAINLLALGGPVVKRLYRLLLNPDPTKDFYPNTIPFSLFSDPSRYSDLSHIFWCQSFLDTSVFLRSRHPLIITLHDMWHLTGGCSYSFQCNGYLNQCKSCEYVRPLFRRTISRQCEIKHSLLARNNTHIVATSHWMHQALLDIGISRSKVSLIRNIIPTHFRYLNSRSICQALLGWDECYSELINLYFVGNTQDPRKGFHHFINALQAMDTSIRKSLRVQVLGLSEGASITALDALNIPYKTLGYYYDEISQVIAYNAADFLVCPSIQDNTPNVVAEAQMCGVPVICFSGTGAHEMITDLTGLAARYSDQDLANSLAKAVTGESAFHHSSVQYFASQQYSYEATTAKYLTLYQKSMSL